MPYFRADVIDQTGASRTVRVEANDQKHALERLRKRNFFPSAVVQDDPPAAPAPASAPIAHAHPAPAQPAPPSDVAALQAELAQMRQIQNETLNQSKKHNAAMSTLALYLLSIVMCFIVPPLGGVMLLGCVILTVIELMRHGTKRLFGRRATS